MSTQQFLFERAKRYPCRIFVAVVFGLLAAMFNSIGTTLIVPAVFVLLDNSVFTSAIQLPPWLQVLTAPATQFSPEIQAVAMLGLIVVAILLKNLAYYLSVMAGATLTHRLTQDLRTEGIELLLTVDLEYHTSNSTGDMIQQLNDQVSMAVNSVGALVSLSQVSLNLVFFTGILLAISWPLTVVACLFLGGILLLNRYIVARAKAFGYRLSEASKYYSISALEMLNGIRLVKAQATERAEGSKLNQFITRREQAAVQAQANAAVIGPLNEVLSIVALVSMILVSWFWLDHSVASVTLLLTFLFILTRVIQLTGPLNSARSRLANSIASVEAVHNLLRRDNKPFMVQGQHRFNGLCQSIRFDHVSFRYPNANTPALVDVSLALPKGKTLALVGASGAGKSTLADLLPRFYDPTSGRIWIDGVDLREFDLVRLRRAMGIVSQDTFLFNATVRDNMAYGQSQATEKDIVFAAKQANAWDFIQALPQGVETVVGDRGVLLSGGQRQRIAIARALLQNPPILILDEATSALDSVSEKLVQEALDRLKQDRTTLVIAHRLSTVLNADHIVVLEQGRVVEQGTHATLMRLRGRYRELYQSQFAISAPSSHPESTA